VNFRPARIVIVLVVAVAATVAGIGFVEGDTTDPVPKVAVVEDGLSLEAA